MTRVTNNSMQSTIDNMANTPNFSQFNINISPFNGEPENLEFFVSQVKNLSKLNKWSDDCTVLYAKSKLQGPAQIFISQKDEYKPLITSEELFKTLREQFRKPTICKSITDFNTFSMIPGETIRNMTHRLDALAPRAHVSIKDTAALDAIKFNKLISILPSDFRRNILQNNITNYSDAVEKAILLQDCEINNSFLCQTTSVPTPMKQIQEELHSLKQTFQNFSETQDQQKSNSFQRKKYNNNKSFAQKNNRNQSNNKPYQKNWHNNQNHKKWSKPYSQMPNNTQQESQQPFMNSNLPHSYLPTPNCQFCGQFGHVVRFCPKFKHYFMPINSVPNTQNTFQKNPYVDHLPQYPHTQVNSSQNEFANSLTGSNLNPDAEAFQPHPNW